MAYPDIFALLEQGARDEQCDSVKAIGGSDGSWVLGVADGTSVAPEAARAALSLLPSKIRSRSEMLEVFADANAAVRALSAEWSSPIDEDRQPLVPYETTMCVAAWTPESGLLAAWVGDSIPFLLPSGDERCWIGRPMEMHGLLIVGNFAVMPDGQPSESLADGLYWLSDSVDTSELEALTDAGNVLVGVVSDGAYNAYVEPFHPTYGAKIPPSMRGGWAGSPTEMDEPIEGLVVPTEHRQRAGDTCHWIMRQAREHELHDNTAVAVASIRDRRP